MKYLTILLFIIGNVFAGTEVSTFSKTSLTLYGPCQNPKINTINLTISDDLVLKQTAYMYGEKKVLPIALKGEEVFMTHEGQSYKIGTLKETVEEAAKKERGYRPDKCYVSMSEIEVVLEPQTELGFNTKKMKNVCAGASNFKGHSKTTTDVLLIDKNRGNAAKVFKAETMDPKASDCKSLKSIGTGIIEILTAPLVIFTQIC